jgi:hypothetical protein
MHVQLRIVSLLFVFREFIVAITHAGSLHKAKTYAETE